jgi:hypothetical protein
MVTIGDRYVLGGKRDHDRLRMISESHDGRLGYVTRWAATQGVDAIGIDVNPEQVAAAQALAVEAGLDRAECRTGGVYEPGLEPETVHSGHMGKSVSARSKPLSI